MSTRRTSDEFEHLDATAQAQLVAAREVTPSELVEAAIARLEARNPSLNAVVHLDLAGARQRAADGPVDGPFRGVPFVTKDLVAKEAGRPFHEGNVHLKEIGHTAGEDQEYIVRTRRAGLISLGRTNVPEFGMRPVCEPLAYGPTNNPWDLSRSPGGSTGGGAAAVAAGIVAIAHANDVGGSIRAPASHNGLVGLKPSRGRSSLAPDFFDAMGGMAEELVVTRSVRDTALALDALASRPCPGDWHPTWPAAPSYVAASERDPAPLRIGIVPDHPANPSHEHVAATVRSVADTLEQLGHHVDVSHPQALDEDLLPLLLPHYTAGVAWMVDHHWPRTLGHALPVDGIEPTTAVLADIGRTVSGGALLEARELAQAWTRRLAAWWSTDHDILLCPVVSVPPPRTGDEHDDLALITWLAPFNLSGQPALAVPGAVHDGLPIGVQLVADHGRDDLLLALAGQLERATGWLGRRPPPLT